MTPGDYFATTKTFDPLYFEQSCFVLPIRFIDQIEINLFAIVSD